MYNHAPPDYLCPFCLLLQGVESQTVYSLPQDIVYRDDFATALVSSHTWGNNRGNCIVIPNEHFENIYDLPPSLAGHVHRVARLVALAMKQAYTCGGISTRQHNEAVGQQDVWHYHLHIFPRYEGDLLYQQAKRFCPPEERLTYANALKKVWQEHLHWQEHLQ